VTGSLSVPRRPRGIVVLSRDGSHGFSARQRRLLFDAGLATLLLDRLTLGEVAGDLESPSPRLDLPPPAERVIGAIDWLANDQGDELPRDVRDLPIGLCGAGTAAAAMLIAAAECGSRVGAIVSQDGRADLAADALPLVVAPTLLIVAVDDPRLADVNQKAQVLIAAEARLEAMAGPRRWFDDPAISEQVSLLTRGWLVRHLSESHPVLDFSSADLVAVR
jgi:putative phosphoribosyl transferase